MVSSSLLLLSAGIGTGVLVLPRAMADVGILPMLALLAVGCLLSAFTTWILFCAVAACREDHRAERLLKDGAVPEVWVRPTPSRPQNWPAYADLLLMITPPWTSIVLDSLLVLYAIGAIMTYLLFLADFLSKLTVWYSMVDQNGTIVLMASLVFVLSLFKSVGGLARLSSSGLIALTCMAVGIWIRAPEVSEQREAPLAVVKDMETLPAVLCISVYAFMWHTNCVTVARELQNPTRWRCFIVAFASTALLYVVYALIAFGGYLSWGDKVAESRSIVAMYAENDVLFVAIRVLLSVAMVITTAVNVYPLRESCIGLVKSFTGRSLNLRGWSHAAWAGIIMVVSATLAIAFPNVVAIITLLGGTLAACMMLVFPSIIAKMVVGERAWLLVMATNFTLVAMLLLAGFGLIGRPA